MAGSVISPVDPQKQIRGVLFDLDGTLYHQPRLRSLMMAELLTLPLYGLTSAPRRYRALAAYRQAQEELRRHPPAQSLAEAQLTVAAARAGLPLAAVRSLVDEWMMKRPLKYLRWCKAAGLDDLLEVLRQAGVRIGVLSDYPAAEKLRAMGLAGRFSPVLCAADPEIGVLKPNPRGFLHACEIWGLDPQDVLVVGDRAEVDAAGAAAAGMSSVIVSHHAAAASQIPACVVFPSLERLSRVFQPRR